jgi:cathepsin D
MQMEWKRNSIFFRLTNACALSMLIIGAAASPTDLMDDASDDGACLMTMGQQLRLAPAPPFCSTSNDSALDNALVDSHPWANGTLATADELSRLQDPVAVVPLTKQRVVSKKGDRNFTTLKSVYSGEIQVGGNTFSVVFDSGSGHLILPGLGCYDKACLKHRQYGGGVAIDADGNPVSTEPGTRRDQLTVNFGTGEVTAVFARDSVCVSVPTSNTTNASVCNTANVLQAKRMSDNPFADFSFDGVFGLSLPGLSQEVTFNMATELTKALPSGSQAFSFFFSHHIHGSRVAFGGMLDRFRGPLAWIPVLDPEDGYWKVAVETVHIGGTVLELCAKGCNGVADTGTSVLAGPSELVKAIRAQYTDIFFLDGECRSNGTQGDDNEAVSVFLGGVSLDLGVKDFSQVRRPLDGSEPVEGTACELMLMRLDVPQPLGPLVILGEPFLSKYYTVFDVEHERVGFAEAVHDAPIGDRVHGATNAVIM